MLEGGKVKKFCLAAKGGRIFVFFGGWVFWLKAKNFNVGEVNRGSGPGRVGFGPNTGGRTGTDRVSQGGEHV